MTDIQKKILQLKAEKQALILSHYYMPLDIQEISDFVCDSFDMAKKASEAKESLIVICGVHFMGESAKILSPDKKILLPVPDAGCPMADMVTVEDIKRLRAAHPNAAVMCYVNSSASVKAVSDVCCTSSSALRIAAALPNDEIIFVPDKNLGGYTAGSVPNKSFFCHTGCCPVHDELTETDILAAKRLHPAAKFAVHPECRAEVLKHADFIGSTSEIIEFCKSSAAGEIIIGTECGVTSRLEQDVPSKKFYSAREDFLCADMKKVTAESVLSCLENERFEVTLDPSLIKAAEDALNKMISM